MGRIKNKKFDRISNVNISRFKRDNERPQVRLINDDGRSKMALISKLVLTTFDCKPDINKYVLNYKDNDKFNFALNNLMWGKSLKRKANCQSSSVQLRHATDGIIDFKSVHDCAKYLKSMDITISIHNIYHYCSRKVHKYGYQFVYTDHKKYMNKVGDLADEQWALYNTTPSGNRHFISSLGRLKCIKPSGKEKLLAQHYAKRYYKVSTQSGNNSRLIHRLVAEYHVPNPDNYTFVDHINGNSIDNRASNLRWVKDLREDLGRVPKYASKEPIEQININNGKVIKVWEKVVFVKRKLGFSSSNILEVCKGKRKTAHGFGWRFASEKLNKTNKL